GGDDFVNSGYQHIRYNFNLVQKRNSALEAFRQCQFYSVNLFAMRQLVTACLRCNPLERYSGKITVCCLPMHEFEMLTNGVIERNVRQSSYLLFFVTHGKFEFQTINYYQPRWDKLSDYRLSSFNSIEIGVLSWLRIVSTAELLYDS